MASKDLPRDEKDVFYATNCKNEWKSPQEAMETPQVNTLRSYVCFPFVSGDAILIYRRPEDCPLVVGISPASRCSLRWRRSSRTCCSGSLPKILAKRAPA